MNYQANEFRDINRRLVELEQATLLQFRDTISVEDDATCFRIYFDSRRVSYSGQEYVIEKAVRAIRAAGQCRVMLTGHTDRHGDHGRNMTTGAERALCVAGDLAANGISSTIMDIHSCGPRVPRLSHDPNSEEADRMNRRVEIEIIMD